MKLIKLIVKLKLIIIKMVNSNDERKPRVQIPHQFILAHIFNLLIYSIIDERDSTTANALVESARKY